MARMIDSDALMDVIRQHEYRLATKQGSIDYGMFTLGIQQAVDEQPTIDAVPVVRCRECKYHNNPRKIVMHVSRRKESERMGIQFECPVCGHKTNTPQTNADRIRSMSDEELAEFLTHINPTNCQDCAFSHGWRCHPDRDDYSSFEKCKEGRKKWLQQPAKEN